MNVSSALRSKIGQWVPTLYCQAYDLGLIGSLSPLFNFSRISGQKLMPIKSPVSEPIYIQLTCLRLRTRLRKELSLAQSPDDSYKIFLAHSMIADLEDELYLKYGHIDEDSCC